MNIKGINGDDLGIDEAIYNDTPNIGNRDWALRTIVAGMYDDLTSEQLLSLMDYYKITEEDLVAAKKADLTAAEVPTKNPSPIPKGKKKSAFGYR